MGFLDRFKGGSPKVAIAADPPEPLPGQELRVRVTISGEIDKKTKKGRVGVRCLNDYLEREYDRRDEEWDEVWKALSLHEDARDVPLEIGDHDFTFTIPEGLPPDSKEAVSWWAFVNLDREMGIDAKVSKRLPVRLRSTDVPSERRSIPPTKDGVGFEDLPASVAAGQTLDGTISVTPTEDVKTTGVKVTLTRVATYTADKHTITRKQEVAKVDVAEGQEMAAGQTYQFPFSVGVPPNPGPTARAPHTVVEWVVGAAAARRMRFDLEATAPVVVYDGP